MRKKFEVTLTLLSGLNEGRTTLVTYYQATRELVLYQHGGVIVRLTHLVGLLDPLKRTTVIYPKDLVEIKSILTYLTESEYPIIVAPIKSGFRIYTQGDITYTSKPKHLTDLVLYSIKNPIAIRISRILSEEVKFLFNLLPRRVRR